MQAAAERESDRISAGDGSTQADTFVYVEYDSYSTRRRASGYPFSHLYPILGTSLGQAGPSNHLSFCPAEPLVELSTAHPETKYRCARLSRPYILPGCLQGAFGTLGRGPRGWI